MRSPFENVALPSDRHREEMHFLEPEQVNELADAITDRYRTAIHLAAYGGLRAGELWALAGRPGERPRPYRRGRRECERSRRLACRADKDGEVLHDHGPLSSWRRCSPNTSGGIRPPMGSCSRPPKAGRSIAPQLQAPPVHANGSPEPDYRTDLRFHDLRHTCVAMLIVNGRHMEEVKDYLGHSPASVSRPTVTGTCSRRRGAPLVIARRNVPLWKILGDFLGTNREIAMLPNVSEGRELAPLTCVFV